MQDGGPALSQAGVAITTCKFANFCPHYVYLTPLMAGVGALVISLMLGHLKMQKELNEKGLRTYLLVTQGRGYSPVLYL